MNIIEYNEIINEAVEIAKEKTNLNHSEIKKEIYNGSIKFKDIYFLEKLKAKTILEIGSYVGISSKILLEILKPIKLVSIDPNIKHRIFKYPREIYELLNKKYIENKSIEPINGFFRTGGFPIIKLNQKFDLIFIDADHNYDSIKNDFFESLELLNNNGTILIHDVHTWPGVKKFYQEIKNDNSFIVKISNIKKSHDGFFTVKRQFKLI